MSTGLIEILEDAFKLLLKNKIIFLPVLIVNLISLPFYLADFSKYGIEYWIGEILFAILGILAYLVTINLAYSSIKKKTSLGQGAIVNYMAATVIYFLIVFAGIILFIIPGIYLAVRMYLYPNVIVVDKKGPIESLKRSWKVTKNKWWLTFGIGLVIGLATLVVVMPIFMGLIMSGISEIGIIIALTLIFLILIVTSVWGIVAYLIEYLRISKHR